MRKTIISHWQVKAGDFIQAFYTLLPHMQDKSAIYVTTSYRFLPLVGRAVIKGRNP